MASNDSVDQSNSTSVHPFDQFPGLKIIPWILTAIGVATVVTSSLMFMSFYRFKNLQTAFNVYLVHLGICDFGEALLALPGYIIIMMLPCWPLGDLVCQIWLYLQAIFSAAIYNGHVLICINRLWAVMFPVHYKMYHNTKVAMGLCVGMWVYLHVWFLPYFIPHSFLSETPNPMCSLMVPIRSNPAMARLVNVFLFSSPEWITVIIYVIICIRIRMLARANKNCKSPPPSKNNLTNAVTSSLRDLHITDDVTTDHLIPHFLAVPVGLKIPTTPTKPRQKTPSGAKFKTLTYLMITVVVCWTPTGVYHFMHVDNPRFFAACKVLFFFSSLVNPMLYALAKPEWALAFRRVLKV